MTIEGFRAAIDARDCTKTFFDVTGNGLYLEEIVYKPETLCELVVSKKS